MTLPKIYQAPELMSVNKVYSYSADIWAVGCLIYNMVTGIPPFYEKDDKALGSLIKHGRYSGVFPEYDANASNEMREIIANMLSIDPRKRMKAEELINHPWIANAQKDFTKKLIQEGYMYHVCENMLNFQIKF